MTALRRVLLADWPVKLTALILAVLLWAALKAREPATQLVNVELVVEPPAGQTLMEPVPQVRALYTGPARELLKLLEFPPMITKILPDSARGGITLDLVPDDLVLPSDADVAPHDVQPRRLHLRLRPEPPSRVDTSSAP